MSSKTQIKSFLPKKSFTLVLTITALFYLGLALYMLNFYWYFKSTQKDYIKLRELTHTITYLDEVLTMSAYMAAATGEQKWQERYNFYEPLLDSTIKEARQLAKQFNMDESIAKTDTANSILVAIERNAFDLIHQGKFEAAKLLLESEEYKSQKESYRIGMEQVVANVNIRLEKDIDFLRRHSLYALISIFIVIPGLIIAWYLILKSEKRTSAERSLAEAALQRERNLLRTLIDNLPDLIYFKDSEGKYILNNLPHLRSIGAKSQSEVLGKTTFDYNPEELAKQYYDDEMKIVQTAKPLLEKEEVALHRDTGEERWHLTSKIPLIDEQGKVYGIVGISRDITEKKKIEEELVRERNLLRNIIDNVPEMINYKDTEGRYLLNNRSHLRCLGVERQEDVLGKTMYDFHPSELAQKYYEAEMAVIRSGKPLFDIEEIVFHRDINENRWHLTSKVPLKDAQGNVVSIITISTDITERKRIEQEREKLIKDLQTALSDIKTLSGLVPICANCKKIRDDKGYWTQVERYIQEHSQARFSHGICPDCFKILYPDYAKKD